MKRPEQVYLIFFTVQDGSSVKSFQPDSGDEEETGNDEIEVSENVCEEAKEEVEERDCDGKKSNEVMEDDGDLVAEERENSVFQRRAFSHILRLFDIHPSTHPFIYIVVAKTGIKTWLKMYPIALKHMNLGYQPLVNLQRYCYYVLLFLSFIKY